MIPAFLTSLITGEPVALPTYKFMTILIMNFVKVPSLTFSFKDGDGVEQTIEKGILSYKIVDDNGAVNPAVASVVVPVSSLNFQDLPTYANTRATVSMLPYDYGKEWVEVNIQKKLRELATLALVDSIENNDTMYTFTQTDKAGKTVVFTAKGTDLVARTIESSKKASKGENWKKVSMDIATNRSAEILYRATLNGGVPTDQL
jgi:hypothetical protein